MPKFQIHTDKGDFIIETENPANTPAGQAENARITEEERRWRSLGIPTDDSGRPNSRGGPTTSQQLAYDLAYPSPGKALAGDVATLLAGFASRIPDAGTMRLHPGKLIPKGLKGLISFEKNPAESGMNANVPNVSGYGGPHVADAQAINRSPMPSSPYVPGFGESAAGQPGSVLDALMPNRTGGPYPRATVPTPPQSTINLGTGMDRYMPNVSGLGPNDRPIQTHRVPYGVANPPPGTAGPLNVSHGFPSSLEDSLAQAVDAVRAEGSQPGGGSGPGATSPISAGPPSGPSAPGTPFTLEEAAQALRRYYGSDEAARQAFLKNTPANKAHILELAGGPSRVPLSVEEKTLDELFRQMVDKDK